MDKISWRMEFTPTEALVRLRGRRNSLTRKGEFRSYSRGFNRHLNVYPPFPDHTQLSESDGTFVKNFQEHPQSILLTDSIV